MFFKRSFIALPLFLALAIGVQSCGKESGCNIFGSENYSPDAVIDDGSCIEVRDKFIGQYSVTSDCIVGAYLRTINETSDRFTVEISNIGDTLGTVTAEVAGPNITIHVQPVRNNVTVDGAGLYFPDENLLHLSYVVRDSRSGELVEYYCLEDCLKN